MQWRKRRLIRYVIGSASRSLLMCQYLLGTNGDESADSQSDEEKQDMPNGIRSTSPPFDEADHYNFHHSSYEYEQHVHFVKENGFLPFPAISGSGQLVSESQEEGVAGCYVNGLWIPNTELFKYGIQPPASHPTNPPNLVYHPNVPWVCLRPLQQGGPGQQSTPGSPTIPSNAQYFLYFTRKPPPWVQHQRDGWRRRHHNHHHSNLQHQPSPYWSFNQVHPMSSEWEETNQQVREIAASIDAELVQQMREHMQEFSIAENASTPYVYPGYGFGQPVFTAPVLPIKQTHQTLPDSKEASPQASAQVEPSEEVEPVLEQQQPVSEEPLPDIVTKPAAEPVAEPITKPITKPVTEPVYETVTKSAAKPIVEATQKASPVKPQTTKVQTAQPIVSKGGATANQKLKKKKRRKKTKAEMDVVPEDSAVNQSTPTKPDHLDLKKKQAKTPQLANGDVLNLCNGKDEIASIKKAVQEGASIDQHGTATCSKPILDFAESLVQITLVQVQDELRLQANLRCNKPEDDTAEVALKGPQNPAASPLASKLDDKACVRTGRGSKTTNQ